MCFYPSKLGHDESLCRDETYGFEPFNSLNGQGPIAGVLLLSDFSKDLMYIPCSISRDWIVSLPPFNALHNKG